MKTKILLLLSVILINVHVFGQSDHIIDLTNHNLFNHSTTGFDKVLDNKDGQPDQFVTQITNNRDLQDLWRLDSTITYAFVSEFDSIANNRRLYTYDDVNKTVEYTEITLSGPNSTWVNTNRNLWYFNDENLQIQNIRFKWSQDQWIEDWKVVYVYDENNRQIENANYRWDGINEIWLNDSKLETNYNDQGLEQFYILYFTEMYSNDWLPFSKHETTYNESGLKEVNTTLRWSNDSSAWYNFERTTYTYDDNVESYYYDYWDTIGWKPYIRYDGLRLDSITVMYSSYSYVNDSVWDLEHRSKLKSREDSSGDFIFYESYDFVETSNSWGGNQKFEKFDNEFGQLELNIRYTWIANEEWMYKSKYQRAFNEHQIPFYGCESNWSFALNGWKKGSSATSYFKNISAINEANNNNFTSIFPNPCNNLLNLSIENQNTTEIHFKIRSVTGQLADEGSVPSSNTITLNVEHLEKGLYLIQIDNGKTISTGKFMKL
ncbi:MAG: T9SS type A sorting domain-containing protein [Bacteroidales bacterium]|nr:T9SS type A sorting domain-containing protein [Bacteroidales bacterium]